MTGCHSKFLHLSLSLCNKVVHTFLFHPMVEEDKCQLEKNNEGLL